MEIIKSKTDVEYLNKFRFGFYQLPRKMFFPKIWRTPHKATESKSDGKRGKKMYNNIIFITSQQAWQQLLIRKETLESVDQCMYLGQVFSANTAEDIKERMVPKSSSSQNNRKQKS